MKSFTLNQVAVKKLAQIHATPLLVLSIAQVAANYDFLRKHLPRVKVFYAMKANPDAAIVRQLAQLGSCFDVASAGEMEQLVKMGIAAERMVYANPFKTPQGMTVAKQLGVNKFTYDSESEIAKIAKAIPGATVLLRIRVDNSKALVDLNKKFGAAPEDALDLLNKAREQGLDVGGLCFHVGSQSPTAAAHKSALLICRQLFDMAAQAGFALRILDIGGGLPIPTVDMAFDLPKMVNEINGELERLFPQTEIWAEPGRFICGTAMNLITSVIGTQNRDNQRWYFLDDGLYGTFSGILFDHWKFSLESFKTGPLYPATLAGPSCDSLDVLFRDEPLPQLVSGDLLLVPNCGAYTSASATEFNGFAKTKIVVWEDEKAKI